MSFNFYGSFQAMENALHDVKAYATSRELGDFVGCAESGAENQRNNICFTQPLGFIHADNLFFQRLGFNLLGIDSTTVIFDLDDNLIALVISIQPNGSARWFSQTGTLCRVFNAVTDRVAHEMSERLGDGVQQAFIKIGVLTAYDQVNLLAALLRDIADHSRKAAEQLLYRDHSNLHYRTLQVIQYA